MSTHKPLECTYCMPWYFDGGGCTCEVNMKPSDIRKRRERLARPGVDSTGYRPGDPDHLDTPDHHNDWYSA